MANILRPSDFETNVPKTLALRYPEGKIVEGRYGDQVQYSLTEPRDTIFFAPLSVGSAIHSAEIQPGELFQLCKREVKDGNKKRVEWQVLPMPTTDDTGIEDSELTRDMKRSLHIANQGKGTWPERKEAAQGATRNDQPAAPLAVANRSAQPTQPHINGNGTTASNGNGHHNGTALAVSGQPPMKIPMDQAALLAVRWMQRSIQDTGEQWSDGSRQDYAASILIAMQKEGWICLPSVMRGAA